MSGSPQNMRIAVLLFSDLVGSVAVQDRVGTQIYSQLLARHHEIFRQAIEVENGGKILNYTGDGFLAELPSGTAAVKAALRFQYLLTNEKWEPEPLQARVAVYLGEITELVDARGDVRHVGMAVNYAARLMDLGGAKQILMSRPIWDDARRNVRVHPAVAEGELLPELDWKAHGLYKFKGGDEPVEVYEVGARGIATFIRPPDSAKASRVVEAIPQFDRRTALQRLLKPSPKERKAALKAGAAAALVGALLLVFHVFDGLSYDLAYLFRGESTPDEVVLVEMDSASIDDLRQQDKTWDRALHGELLDKLSALGAKAVGFDILFSVPSKDTNADQRFFQAMTNSRIAVLGAPLEVKIRGMTNVALPFDLFRDAAALGVVERGGSVIRNPTQGFGEVAPFSGTLARIAGLGEKRPPANAWIRYYGPPGAIAHHSYSAVISNEVSRAAISNKVVIVGANMGIGFADTPGADYFNSPYARFRKSLIAGVEINATTYANLVRGEWLWRLAPMVEFVITLAFGLLAGWVCALLPRVTAVKVALAAGLAVAVGACAQVWATSYWFPWAGLVVGALPVALGIGVMRHR